MLAQLAKSILASADWADIGTAPAAAADASVYDIPDRKVKQEPGQENFGVYKTNPFECIELSVAAPDQMAYSINMGKP